MIEIPGGVAIPDEELRFIASRSGGPGGQHVNKVSSRMTLRFDVGGSPSLTPRQKERLGERLRTRIGADGVLRVVSSKHRSQLANREAAVVRFRELLALALAEPKERRSTRVPAGARQRRIEEKKRRGHIKKGRAGGDSWEG